MNKKTVLAIVGLACAFTAIADEPSLKNFSFRQRWPWSRAVDVDFVLDAAGSCDVELKATYAGAATPVTIRQDAVVDGRMNALSAGRGHVAWDPVAAGIEAKDLTGFKLTADVYLASTRKYLVIDLKDGSSEYYSSAPEGGWTNDVYKTDKMVFARIPAGTQRHGLDYLSQFWGFYASDYVGQFIHYRNVTISSDFYMAIYKTTGTQFKNINGSTSESGMKPYIYASYNAYRGAAPAVNWPQTKFAVAENSVVDKFRKLTGGRFLIDLPTEGQWEHAARAGSTADSVNETIIVREGATVGKASGAAIANQDDIKDRLTAAAWCYLNRNVTDAMMRDVGLLKPNAWGLYDVIGDGCEWMLDAGCSTTDGTYMKKRPDATDPVGYELEAPATRLNASCRVGGSADGSFFSVMFAYRRWTSATSDNVCSRFVIHLDTPFK